MQAQPVMASLEQFISRVTSGKGKPEELTILPSIVDIYLTHNAPKQDQDPPQKTKNIPETKEYREEQLLTVAQVSELLGYKPGTIYKKLREGDPKMPHPHIRDQGSTRWLARDVFESGYYQTG